MVDRSYRTRRWGPLLAVLAVLVIAYAMRGTSGGGEQPLPQQRHTSPTNAPSAWLNGDSPRDGGVVDRDAGDNAVEKLLRASM